MSNAAAGRQGGDGGATSDGSNSSTGGAPQPPASPFDSGGFGGLGARVDRSNEPSRASSRARLPEAGREALQGTVEWWRRVTASPLAMGSTNVNLTDSLPVMEGRKSLRRFRGAYQKTRPVLAWFMFILLLTIWTFASSSFDGITVSATFALRVGVETKSQVLYFMLLGLLLLYMLFSIRVMTQYNLAFSWVITGIFVVISIADVLLSASIPWYTTSPLSVRDALVAAFLLVQAFYLISCYVLRHILPYLQMRGWFLIKTVLLDEISTADLQRLAAAIPTDPRYRVLPATGRLASSSFKYVQVLFPVFRIFVRKRDRISYSGEVDSSGRPHGYGLWTDTHWHGETLEGWWAAGAPIAPFKSRETGSGSGFACTRIGYFQCRADGATEASFLPRNAPLSLGVASAECSVSGFFFRDYPLIRFLTDAMTPAQVLLETSGGCCQRSESGTADEEGSRAGRISLPALRASVEWVMSHLILMDDKQDGASSVVITAHPRHGLRASGFIRPGTVTADDSSRVVDSITVQAVHTNESTQRADKRLLPRLAASGSGSGSSGGAVSGPSPPTLLMSPKRTQSMLESVGATPPVAPCSGVLCLSGWRSCYATEHREAILYIHGYNSPLEWGVKGLGQLIALGNFPSYLKPFVFSWPTGRLFAFLAAKRGASTPDTVQAFIDALRALDQAGFRRVHILTHSMGVRTLLKALPHLLSLLSNRQSASPTSEPPRTSSGSVPENAPTPPLGVSEDVTLMGDLSIATITMLNPEFGLCEFLRSCARSLRTICPLVTIYGDLRDTALYGAELWNAVDATLIDRSGSRKQNDLGAGPSLPTHNDGMEEDGTCCCGALIYERSLGNNLYNIKGLFGEPLDIDIIDTTFLEANVHDVRHNAFSLNRDIVEDLRDVITTFRRASQRPRLEARGGNVFSFMVAPAHVVAPT